MEPENFVTPNTELRRKHLPSPSTRKDQSYESYIQLLKEHGLEINPKCFPSYFALKNGLQYPGIACSQKISANEVLVRVPKKLVLSSYVAIQRPELQQVFKERFYHEDWAWEDRVLNTYLLYIYGQEQKSNVWYHLVKHLPKQIDIIGFWPEEDLDKFKDLTVKSAAEQDNESFQQEWAQFQKIQQKHPILQHQVFSKENYRWIFIHLVSRCFGKQLQFTSMVPFCELFNHHAVDGHYDVEILPQKVSQSEGENLSITTEGSYLSQDYIEVGEFAYDEIDSKPHEWLCREKENLNEKEKKIILDLAASILTPLDNDINWQDVSILFVPHIIERCKLVEIEYKAGRRTFEKALADLKTIEEGINFYKKNIAESYNKWRGKTFKYKTHAQMKQQQEEKKAKQKQNPQTQEGIIQFPKEQKRQYDNFLLLTGQRDQYLPPNQVYFCYGRNSNRTLLLRYGFAIEGNKYEHVWLSFDIVNSLIHYPDTVQQLQDKHLSLRRKFKLKINRLNMELIMFFRLNSWSYMSNKSIEELFKIKDYGKQICILVQIKESIEARLEMFLGPYNLTDPKLSYHEYFIAVYHQEKEKILSQHVQFLQTIIKLLKNLEKGADLAKETENFTPQERYIFRHYLSQLQ